MTAIFVICLVLLFGFGVDNYRQLNWWKYILWMMFMVFFAGGAVVSYCQDHLHL